jgi:hypothetical protein
MFEKIRAIRAIRAICARCPLPWRGGWIEASCALRRHGLLARFGPVLPEPAPTAAFGTNRSRE